MSRLQLLLNREPIFINPYTDFGFKRLFGEEGTKDLLIDFLNQLLPVQHQIASLKFRNPENIPDLQFERKAFFDISCTAITGEEFIVEMQKAKVKYFKDRSIFYTTYPIRRQAKRGEWDFRLRPVYFIAILDFDYDEDLDNRKILREVSLKDQDGELFYDKLHFKYIQMPCFNKNEAELETHFDKWLFFLKNLENFEEIPKVLNEPIFQKGFEIAKIAKMKAVDYERYEKSRLIYSENKAVLDMAREEAWNEAWGKAWGKAWNEAWGEAWNEATIEKAQQVVINCLSKGITPEITAEIAGVPLPVVLKMVEQLKSNPKL